MIYWVVNFKIYKENRMDLDFEKISIKQAFIKIFVTLKYSLINIIAFEIMFKLLIMLVFRPFIKEIFLYFSVNSTGLPSMANGEIKDFLLSFPGILMILMLAVICGILVYYEFAVLYIFLYSGFNGQTCGFIFGLKKGFHSLKSLLHISSAGFIVYILVLIPLIHIGINSSIIPEIEIPEFITGEILKYPGGVILLDLIMYLPLLVFIKTLFVIPNMVLSGLNFKDSMKLSLREIKGNTIRIIVVVLVACLVVYIPNKLLYNAIAADINPIVYFIYGKLIDIIQAVSTPLILSAIVVCFMTNSKAVIDIQKQIVPLITRFKDFARECISRIKSNAPVIKKHTPKIISKHPYILVTLVGIIIIFAVGLDYYSFEKDSLIIGHRGSLDGVENSIQAILGAERQKADYAEIDVLLSKDGVPVVIHDVNLIRLSGSLKNIYDLTASEIKEISVSQDDFEDRLYTLDEVCKSIKDINLLVELKTHGHETENLIDKVVEVLKRNNVFEKCMFQSSEYELIEEMKLKHPNAFVGYIIISSLGDMSSIISEFSMVDFFSVEASVVNEKLVNSCHREKKQVYVWTVNDESTVKRLLSIRVDGIITDYPEDVRKTIVKL